MVTAMPGGPAAKAGKRYEDLCLVLRVSELLEGRVSRIRPEPLGDLGLGVEYELDRDGVTWAEQAKSTADNWTIARLEREGVLGAAQFHVGEGRRFRLVAAAQAGDLGTLAFRAEAAESLEEYIGSLGDGRRDHFSRLAELWDVSEEEAWRILRGIDVKHFSLDALELSVATTVRLLFVDDPEVVIGALRGFFDSRVHRSFRAPAVWAYLEARGLGRRLIVGDQNVIGRLRETLQRQLRRVDHAKPKRIDFVPRGDVDEVLAMVRDPEGGQIVVVDGRAGSGKSVVVSDVAKVLDEEGWFVAVARMDIDTSTATADELGQRIGLTESPSVLLAGVSAGAPALLVIDQLDAVSTYSGRMADNFDAVDEVIGQISSYANIKVLLVVRTVDLKADPRLRRFLEPEQTVQRHTIGRLSAEDVRVHLEAHGIQLPDSEVTVELLRTPLHLAVFSRLSDASRASAAYTTLQGLYAQYTRELRLRVGSRVGHLDWVGITGTLVTYMSDNEVLTAPEAVVDVADVQEVEALKSESLLVSDDTGVAFFHESYFDFLFARSFIAAGHDLHSFLVESGQYLFRRAQTRQVLEHLAATNRERFTEVVVDLLTSEGIRPHLKAVVISVLRQIQPTPADWATLNNIAWSSSPIAPKLVSLLRRRGWFDAADSCGHWKGWLEDPERAKAVVGQLTIAERQRPARVAELVRPHIGESDEWRRHLQRLISRSLEGGLIDLAVELIQSGQLDDIRSPIGGNTDFWRLLHSLTNDEPAGAARLIGAYLNRGLKRAKQNHANDPFESGHLSEDSASVEVIVDTATNAPAEFVRHVLPFVTELAMVEQTPYEGELPQGRRWHIRHLSSAYTVDDAVFTAVSAALEKLGVDSPEECAIAIEPLRAAESLELRFLACRALTAMDDSDDAVGWLISDARNLSLGWTESSHWASRELIEKHSPACSPNLLARLEDLILSHAQRWETRRWRGYSRYESLSAVDQSRMSEHARRKLGELKRRFPNSTLQPPKQSRAGTVNSPIRDSASKRMSDDHWLGALRKHTSEDPYWIGDVAVGGAHQLASQSLGPRAKENPERFAKLALQFTDDIPTTAMNEVIRNVAGALDTDLLADLCEHAHNVYGPRVGPPVCSVISRAAEANPRLVALLNVYSNDPDPDHERARTKTDHGEYSFRGDLLTAGLNSTRGQAALAVASVLFSGNSHLTALLPALEALATDDILAVRVCAAEGVRALLNHSQDQALDLAERLFNAPIDVLDAQSSEQLLTHAVLREPNRFARVFAAALAGPATVATRAGRIWAIARWEDQLPEDIATDFRSLPPAARQGAAEVLAANAAAVIDALPQIFNDAEPKVRQQAVRALLNLDRVAAADLQGLVDAFVQSPAFPDHMEFLFRGLTRISSRLPPNTIDACEQAVATAGEELTDMTTRRFAISRDLITVVLRLYRQADRELRARCLDIIDQLTELDIYDLDRTIEDER